MQVLAIARFLCIALAVSSGGSNAQEILQFHYPMQLGRSYDINTHTTLVDIFSPQTVNDAQVEANTYSEAQYMMVKNNQQVHNLLDVSGEFSLSVKRGAFSLDASGKYLKETMHRENAVEILIKHSFKTLKKTIRSSNPPIEDCARMNNDQKGTHYIRSIQYGGYLVGSLRFIAENSKDKQDIEAALNIGGGHPAKLTVEIGASFKKLTETIKGQYRLEYTIFATAPLPKVPSSIDEFLNITLNFPKYARDSVGSEGVPYNVELYPISSLNGCGTNPINWIRNNKFNGDLVDLEGKYDDLSDVHDSLFKWTSLISDTTLKDIYNTKLQEFYTKLKNVKNVISGVIDKLDVSTKGNDNQFDAAFDSYAPDGNDLGNFKYKTEFKKLQDEIRAKNCDSLNGRVTYMGCYKDTNVRDLRYSIDLQSTNSVSNCATHCSIKGYQYSGMQKSMCYCDNTYGMHGEDAKGCNTPCPGNFYNTCGGNERNSIWATNRGFGCPKRFVKRRNGYKDTDCYFFNADAKYTWVDARAHCKDMGGDQADLASISSHMEGNWVSEHSRLLGKTFWLGGRRTAKDFNKWEWNQDILWTSSVEQWSGGQPSNVGGNQRCLEMRSNVRDKEPGGFTWHSQNCDVLLGYVCKVKVMCTR